MANSDKNILITPSVGLSTNPTIKFNGANNTPTTLRVLDDGSVSFESTAGQLFSVSDGLTGTIFSVNDISGIPSIEVLDTGLIKLNQYSGSSVFGGSSAIQSGVSNSKVSIYTSAATSPGLIIKAATSQTANLLEFQNSSGTALSYITSAGTMFVPYEASTSSKFSIGGGNFYINGYGAVYTMESITIGSLSDAARFAPGGLTIINRGGADNIPLGIKGAASQTANLTEWRNSAGSVSAKVDSNGYITSGIFYANNNHYAGYQIIGGRAIVTLDSTAAMGMVNWNTGLHTLQLRNVASQTADSLRIENSSGTTLAKIANNGNLTIKPIPFAGGVYGGIYLGDTSNAWQDGAFEIKVNNAGTPRFGFRAPNASTEALTIIGNSVGVQNSDPQAYLHVNSYNAGNKALIVQGYASQTANLQEWQNSSGTVLASIDKDGNAGFNGGSISLGTHLLVTNSIFANYGNIFAKNGAISAGSGNGLTTLGQITSISLSASTIGLAVRGAASQTANLQEWQNSAGSVLSKVTSDGSIITPGLSVQYGIYSTTAGKASINPNYDTGSMGIYTENAANKGLVVRGAASQSANLQEWHNSSGSVLTSIKNNGEIESNLSRSTRTNYSSYPAGSAINVPNGKIGWVARWYGGGTSNGTVTSQTFNSSSDAPIPELTTYVRKTWTAVRADGVHQDIAFSFTQGGVNAFPVSPGDIYTVSFYARHSWTDIAGSGSFVNRLYFKFYDSAGTSLSDSYITDHPRMHANTWYRISDTQTAPANAAYLEITHIYYSPSNTVLVGSTFEFTGQLVEKTNSLGEYFDGSVSRYDTKFNASTSWSGTTNASTSTVSYISQSTNPIAIKSSSNTITNIDQYGAISAPAIKITGVSLSKNITLSSGYRYFVDTSAIRTLTLPASPTVGDEIQIFDASNLAATNNIILDSNGGRIDGTLDGYLIDANGAAISLTYTGSTYGWKVK